MKKKVVEKKLVLNKEKIAELSKEQMEKSQAGAVPITHSCFVHICW